MSKNKILVSLLIAGGFVSPMAYATDGYLQQGYGVKANGMAGVGIALPQDSLAAATNPAGMVMVGNRADLGLTWFKPTRGADVTGNCLGGPGTCPPAPSLNGSYDGNGRSNFFIPEFGFNKMMNPNMSLGVSVYGNGGMNTSYQTSPFGPNAGINLEQLFIAPTWAMKVNDSNSIGVALNLVYQTFAATGLGGFGPAGGHGFNISSNPAALTDNGTDSSTGIGIRLGWTGEITPLVTLGATYQPKTSMGKFNKYAGLFANQGSFDIPASYGVGIAVKVTPETTIAADYMAIQYGDVTSVGNSLSPLFAGIPLGGSNGPGFGWKNIQVLKLGISQVISPMLTVRAGYSHNTQPIPASQTMFNILAPGVVQDHLTLGATWNVSKQNEVTVAYMHAFENSVNGSGSIPPGAATAGGFGGGEANLHMHEDSLGVAYSWKF